MRGATRAQEEYRRAQEISIHAPHARSDQCTCRLRRRSIFQSTLLMRGATPAVAKYLLSLIFQSTLLMRGATKKAQELTDAVNISIHAPHARSDFPLGVRLRDREISIHAPHARSDVILVTGSSLSEFQSTLLMRGATGDNMQDGTLSAISIHAPHARSDKLTSFNVFGGQISIHAPHARSDPHSHYVEFGTGISIHAPHARSDPLWV